MLEQWQSTKAWQFRQSGFLLSFALIGSWETMCCTTWCFCGIFLTAHSDSPVLAVDLLSVTTCRLSSLPENKLQHLAPTCSMLK